eukprot:EG_transcript_119
MPALQPAYFTSSFQHLYALLVQDTDEPPPAAILKDVQERLADERKAFPAQSKGSRAALTSAAEADLPKAAKDLILKFSDQTKVDELHSRTLLGTYLECEGDRGRPLATPFSAEEEAAFVEWYYEERIARLGCTMMLLKRFPEDEVTNYILQKDLKKTLRETFTALSVQLKALFLAKARLDPAQALQATQMLRELVAVLDLWLVLYLVRPEGSCSDLGTLVALVKTLQGSAHLYATTLPLPRAAAQAIQQAGCVGMLLTLAVLAPQRGNEPWNNTTPLAAEGLEWEDFDDCLQWLVGALGDFTEPESAMGEPATPPVFWGPVHFAAACLASETERGLALRTACANHVWQTGTLPYLLTVLDGEGRYALWDTPPVNRLAYHLLLAELMAASFTTWGWLGTDVALTQQVVAVVAAVEVPPREAAPGEGGPWATLLNHLEVYFPLHPEAALYGRLLAAAARHRCHSVAGLLARLRQLPSCAVAVDEAAAADLDLRNPEELLSSLRLPHSLSATDGITIPAGTVYFAQPRLAGASASVVVCQHRLPPLRLLLHRLRPLLSAGLPEHDSATLAATAVAVLELFEALLGYDLPADNAALTPGSPTATRTQLRGELDAACGAAYQTAALPFLFLIARRLSGWLCPASLCADKLHATALAYRCIQHIAIASAADNDVPRLLEVFNNLHDARLLLDIVTQPHGEGAAGCYRATVTVLELAHASCSYAPSPGTVQYVVEVLGTHLNWGYNALLQRWVLTQWCLRTLLGVLVGAFLEAVPPGLVALYHGGRTNPLGAELLGLLLNDGTVHRVLFTILGHGAIALKRTGVAHQGEVADVVQGCLLMALHTVALALRLARAGRPQPPAAAGAPFEAALMKWMIGTAGGQPVPLIALIFDLMNYPKSTVICSAATDLLALVAQIRIHSADGTARAPALLGYLSHEGRKGSSQDFVAGCLERLRTAEDGEAPRVALLRLLGHLLAGHSSLATCFFGAVAPAAGASPPPPAESNECLAAVIQLLKESSPTGEAAETVAMGLEVLLACWHNPEHRAALLRTAKDQTAKGKEPLWRTLQRIASAALEAVADEGLAAYQWRAGATSLTLLALECYRRTAAEAEPAGGESTDTEESKALADALGHVVRTLADVLKKSLNPVMPHSVDEMRPVTLGDHLHACSAALARSVTAGTAGSPGPLAFLAAFQTQRGAERLGYGEQYFYSVPKLVAEAQQAPPLNPAAVSGAAQRLNGCLSVVDANVAFLVALRTLVSVVLKAPPRGDTEAAKDRRRSTLAPPIYADQLNELIGILLTGGLLPPLPEPIFTDVGGAFAKVYHRQLRELCAALLVELVEGCVAAVRDKGDDSDTLKSHAPRVLEALQQLYAADFCPAAQQDLLTALTLLLDFYGREPRVLATYDDLYPLLPKHLADPAGEGYRAALCAVARFGPPAAQRPAFPAATLAIARALLAAVLNHDRLARADCERQLQLAAVAGGAGAGPKAAPAGPTIVDQPSEATALVLQQLEGLVRLAGSSEGLRAFLSCALLSELAKIQPQGYLKHGVRHPEVTRSTIKLGGATEQRFWHHVWCLQLTIVSQALVTLAGTQDGSGTTTEVSSLADACAAFVSAHQAVFLEVLQGTYISFPGFSAYDLQEADLCLNIVQSLCLLHRALPWLLPAVKQGLRSATNAFSWQSGFPFTSLGLSAADAAAAASQSRSRSRSSQRAESVASLDKAARHRPSQADELVLFRILRGILSSLRSFMTLAIKDSYHSSAATGLSGPVVTFGAAPPPTSALTCMVLDLVAETLVPPTHRRRPGRGPPLEAPQVSVPLTICVDLMGACASRLKLLFAPGGGARRSVSVARGSTSLSQPPGERDYRLLAQILHVLEEAAYLLMLHLAGLRHVDVRALPRDQQATLEQLNAALRGLLATLQQHLKAFEDEVERGGGFTEIGGIESAKKMIQLLTDCQADLGLPALADDRDRVKRTFHRRPTAAAAAAAPVAATPAAPAFPPGQSPSVFAA